MVIAGNAQDEVKEMLSSIPTLFATRRSNKPTFGDSIVERLVVTHASLDAKADEPLKKEGRVVCELIVTEGASSPSGHLGAPTIRRHAQRRRERARRVLRISH